MYPQAMKVYRRATKQQVTRRRRSRPKSIWDDEYPVVQNGRCGTLAERGRTGPSLVGFLETISERLFRMVRLNLSTMPSDCGAKVWSWSCQFRVVHRPPSIPQRRNFFLIGMKLKKLPHISIYSAALQPSRYEVPGYRKAIRSKKVPNIVAMQLPRLRIFGPFRAEQASQDLHHCSTSGLTYSQQTALELGASFHDAEK
ncbi:hypothetical protein TNCV_2452461 [Trichonephila clavipes]|nr:hypothetical protein TNCV_2452461 [Trichonephila clavipes]